MLKRKPENRRVGGLLRNHKGECIVSFGVNMGVCSNNKAEAMATLGGFKTLKELSFKNVIIEGDSKLIVDILNGVVVPPWELKKYN